MPVISIIFKIISLFFIIEMEHVKYIIYFTINTRVCIFKLVMNKNDFKLKI